MTTSETTGADMTAPPAAAETRDKMPWQIRTALLTVVGLLMAGAVYLVSVRGEAIIIDLATIGGKILCF
ncbi:MAG: hypothetical protein ACK5JT_12620 [Hyphomicrobiaceae bacterium]